MTNNQYISSPTTGLSSLDDLLTGLRSGDNIVWQVDDIEDYAALVDPFVVASLAAAAVRRALPRADR